tara:strand:- start:1059 stop:1199 length:141 start_codon:yes stop_codon:yes gene_type:complete
MTKKVVKAALKKPKSAIVPTNLKKMKEPTIVLEPFNAGTAMKQPKN